MSSKIYIVILNYNSATETVSLFQELKKQSFTDFTVIVVDNDSKTEDRAILKKFIPKSNLHLLVKNKGYAAGNKIGVLKALADEVPYVLFLNPDIRLEDTCIEILVSTIKQNDNLAAVGPRICYRNKPHIVYSDGGLIDKEKGMYTHHLHYNQFTENLNISSNLHFVDYVNGSVFLVRTSVFKEIGYMREDFFLYFEETEWCIRASDNGYGLATNVEAIAYHLTSTKGTIYHYYMTRNRLLLAKLYPQYYQHTKAIVWKPLFKKLKKCLKTFSMPNHQFRAQLKGYFVGRLKHVSR